MDEGERPADRNYGTEGSQTVAGMKEVAPQVFDLESTYRPKYAQLNADVLESVLPQYMNLYQQAASGSSDILNEQNTALRTGQISDIDKYGNAAVSAIQNMNPQQNELLSTMNSQAQKEIQANGSLTPREAYSASQVARSAGNARGNVMGNSTVFNEFANNEDLVNQRQDRARNYASGVANMNNSYYNQPALSALGLQTTNGVNASSILNGANGSQTSSGMFDPYNAYASDVYNTNYNAAYNEYLNNSGNNEKLFGTALGLVGAGVGGAFGGPMGAAIGGSTGSAIGSTAGMFF